jgi:hypothetical protein
MHSPVNLPTGLFEGLEKGGEGDPVCSPSKISTPPLVGQRREILCDGLAVQGDQYVRPVLDRESGCILDSYLGKVMPPRILDSTSRWIRT